MQNVGLSLPLRQLGRRLRDSREAAGYSLDRAAAGVEGMTRTSLFRLESGNKAKPNTRDIRALCQFYGVPAEEIDGFIGLAASGAQKGWWWQKYGDLIPREFNVYVAQETAASKIISHQPNLIPGLLQTPQYVLALVQASDPEAEPGEWMRRIEIKKHRKAILTRPYPVQLDVVIGQAALHHVVGNEITMAAQLRHLTELSAQHENVNLRILPFDAGHPGGIAWPPFVVLDFARGTDEQPVEPTTVFLENVVGGIYLDDPADVKTYRQAFDKIKKACLDGMESQRLLTRVAKEYEA